jgi:hypothetical protein
MALINGRLDDISPAFPRDPVTYVYEKTKRVETSNMAHRLGERPTLSVIGRQTDPAMEDTASLLKAPRPMNKHNENKLQLTSGFPLEPATRSPAGHCPNLRPCHRLGRLIGKSPLKTWQRRSQTPEYDTSSKATGNSVLPQDGRACASNHVRRAPSEHPRGSGKLQAASVGVGHTHTSPCRFLVSECHARWQ